MTNIKENKITQLTDREHCLLRPGQYIVRTILDGIYKVATEVTLKGTVRDVNVVIPANIFVSKLSFFFL